MKRLSTSYQLMLLAAAVLAIYYPTQFAEISLVDDAGVISGLLSCDHISLADVFIPRSAGGAYYRPLIVVSYLLDKRLWFLDERLMHFEWMVAHLLNGALVFLLCREAVRLLPGRRSTYLPLAAGLLFSLHPIATESVNWISGRTDIMMGNFVLLSAYLLLRYRRSSSPALLALSVLSALLALLAKEAAFGWLPGFAMLLVYRATDDESPRGTATGHAMGEGILFILYYGSAFLIALYLRAFWLVLAIALVYFGHNVWRQKIFQGDSGSSGPIRRRLLILSCILAMTAALFLIMRRIVFTSDIDKIGNTIKLMGSDPNYTISLFIGAAGFYLKKFFMPLPLNFFIREIDPLYDLLGIAVLLAALRLVIARSLAAIMALTGLFLMLPALPFAFGTIAWTAYAERYIYLAGAFWVIALCLWTEEWLRRHPRRIPLCSGITVGLCLLSAGVTFARNLTWQTNAKLMADTVSHSPHNRKVRDIYMYALLREGRVEEAQKVYRVSSSIHDIYYDKSADLIMGGELVKEGHDREALRLYQGALQRCNFKSEELLAAALDLVRRMKSAGSATNTEHRALSALERDYDERLRKIANNPKYLIDAGRSALREGSLARASSLFDEALHGMSRQDRLYPLALRLRDKVRRDDRSE